MILITSASYLNHEFHSEFGEIPSAFLPLNGKKIYEYQIKYIRNKFRNEEIFISIPKNYIISQLDSIILKRNRINIIRIKSNISLSRSISIFLNKIKLKKQIIRILHGDTIIEDIPKHKNCICIADTHFDYNWEIKKQNLKKNTVWCGYFSFSNYSSLKYYLNKFPNSFENAVKAYQSKYNNFFYKTKKWYDFGHLNSYFYSRSKNLQSRYFNNIIIKNDIVYKKSTKDKNKIYNEYLWYTKLPLNIKRFVPQIFSYNKKDSSYSLEYLTLIPLNEIYVHCNNREFYWYNIFNAIKVWFDEVSVNKKNLTVYEKKLINLQKAKLIKSKTYSRVRSYLDYLNIDFNYKFKLNNIDCYPINTVIDNCINKIMNLNIQHGVMHGDLCFSNILFSPRSNNIKVIDPLGTENIVFGDLLYDYAKLSHSVIGLYDFIISNAYELIKISEREYQLKIFEDENTPIIKKIFMNYKYFKNINFIDIMPIVVLLFLSMAYLHIDDKKRALALFLNGLNIYNKYLK